jgi:uncharacterized protein
MMNQKTASNLIDAVFAQLEPGGHVTFAFQGGEPTLAKRAFFERFTRMVAERRPSGSKVYFTIQTNGLLLDEAWVSLFNEYNFLVGLSLDGTKDIHNLQRVDAQGDGTWNAAIKSLRMLQKRAIDVNLLCVVTRQLALHPRSVYMSLKKLGVKYLQFIPCLDPLGEKRGLHPYSLTPADYGHFLCGLFDLWYNDWKNGRYVSIRLFDDYVHLFMGRRAGSCATTGSCGGYLVVEGDGGIYPCDFYVLDEWCLGNINEKSLDIMMTGETWRRFQQESVIVLEECECCEWKSVCAGGCKRDWIAGETLKNYYCFALKEFFVHASGQLRQMALAEMLALRDR